MRAAAADVKNVTLELGGKSPLVIFEDVDVPVAVEWIMFGAFWTNGQICSSTSRVLIDHRIAPAVLERLREEVAKIHVGDPYSDKDPSMGPLVSKSQYDKVLRYIDSGVAQGARILTGGGRPVDRDVGYYVCPTVFVDVSPAMQIWREEIFGPVVCVSTFTSEADAMRQANDTDFGLAAAVLSKDSARCRRVARAFRAGIVWVNCSQPCFAQAPWGGVKKSGLGRDLGKHGLDAFLEVKQITEYRSDKPWGWYIKSPNSKL